MASNLASALRNTYTKARLQEDRKGLTRYPTPNYLTN